MYFQPHITGLIFSPGLEGTTGWCRRTDPLHQGLQKAPGFIYRFLQKKAETRFLIHNNKSVT